MINYDYFQNTEEWRNEPVKLANHPLPNQSAIEDISICF